MMRYCSTCKKLEGVKYLNNSKKGDIVDVSNLEIYINKSGMEQIKLVCGHWADLYVRPEP